MTLPNLEPLAQRANQGDAQALETLVANIQDQIHRLALRMLADPVQAEDVTQDILIRVITKLSTYRGDSAFRTWVYRVATNHLLTTVKRSQAETMLSFDVFAADLEAGLVDENQKAPEDHILLNELRIGCTMAMLLCLDRPHRIAYILGDVFELDQGEAVGILDISKDLYRQRLSRARKKVTEFTARSCGLAGAQNACTCPKRLPAAIELGRVPSVPSNLMSDAPDYASVRKMALTTEAALVAAKLQRATGPLKAQKNFAAELERIVSLGN
ncbi:ECF RNA polymerase sigma-E factor [Pelagimonas phthalicica]|uniref:ECF RNA polymerase sigma-E factor n=1 Tax=Pelagimonas phthalicica TaxID=1037362 RepID=A0A238JH48_9RHOB|nr:RNA polymerase sigma factor [Pelagimonas phthalicica]TDS89102.1 RNA polymerase ECF family sigma subunit [Pelagimonas phthalicica]SMX29723.1 ECF RNA polymerase sigma-E factor [Pelagimonas phthalicica]